MSIIIAIDFDGTLCDHRFPDIGRENPGAFEWLRKFQDAGARLMLWTMRSDMISDGVSCEGHPADKPYLTEAVEWCRERGIEFWGVNSNAEQGSWTASPKQYAHLYVDDAAACCPLRENPRAGGRPMLDWSIVGPSVMTQIEIRKAFKVSP
ncbi:MAG: hypothetical protein NCW75_05665 [Phycisphaera sp.]|nr:MAG: hypothetical protein NCW75_05665 [Phycisphaera sp.]